VHVAVLVGGVAVCGRRLGDGTLTTALATWVVLGARSLSREGAAVQALLGEGRLVDARRRLTHLVGRDTTHLDEREVARAVVESLAENTSDAVGAPLLWGAVLGPAGLLGYRAANTLDAMVGHRNARYERFGWAAARFDDLLNLPASRLTAALVVLLGPDPAAAARTWRRDAKHHPSPNAGPVEAAFAGALGLRLGGANTYGDRVERRAELGAGPAPAAHDIPRARRLAGRVGVAALIAVLPIAVRRRPR
jgi:adenosylcobinamide-phosphate synthase